MRASAVLGLLAVVALVAACAANASNPTRSTTGSSSAAPAGSATPVDTSQPATEPATRTVVIRPVTTGGEPAPGYTVTDSPDAVNMCEQGAGGVDGSAWSCFPAAESNTACWPSSGHTVLCLQNPLAHDLVRRAIAGLIRAGNGPVTADPIAVRLTDGTACTVRVGGTWGYVPSHPEWVGRYLCGQNVYLYGPNAGDGFDHSTGQWTTRIVRNQSSYVGVGYVATAYFVGLA